MKQKSPTATSQITDTPEASPTLEQSAATPTNSVTSTPITETETPLPPITGGIAVGGCR